jgi:hypothetical protein
MKAPNRSHRPEFSALAWIALGAVVGLGCKDGGRAPVRGEALEETPSLLREMRERAELNPVFGEIPIIPEAEFLRLMSGEPRSSSVSTREEVARIESMSTHPVTLGAFGVPQSGQITVEAAIVARDWILNPDGYAETRDFYIASVRIEGEATYATQATLALSETLPPPRCDARVRGCRGVRASSQDFMTWDSDEEGAIGLPLGVILNLESPAGPLNASGYSPSLRVFGWPDGELQWNEYRCHEEISSAACVGSLPPRNISLNIPKRRRLSDIAVVRESDMLQILQDKAIEVDSNPIQLLATALMATQGNSRVSVGLEALSAENLLIDVPRLIVLRDWGMSSTGRIEGAEWYIVHGRFSGRLPVVGIDVDLIMREIPVGFDSVRGPCGLMTIPTGSADCNHIACFPGSSAESVGKPDLKSS